MKLIAFDHAATQLLHLLLLKINKCFLNNYHKISMLIYNNLLSNQKYYDNNTISVVQSNINSI